MNINVSHPGNRLLSPSSGIMGGFKIWQFLLISISLIVLPMSASARNPDLSFWTQNLSESSASTELGESDDKPEIAVEGSTVHVIWMTHTSEWARYNIYYRRSTDNGQTWEAKKLIYSSTTGLITDKTYKRMVVENNNVHIVFSDYGTRGTWYGKLLYLRSSNNGVSFESPRTLFEPASDAWHVYDTYITTDDGNVTIGFRSQCNWAVNNDYLILNSDDHGATFSQHTVYSTTTGSSWKVSDLQRIGNNIYVLYADSYYYYGIQYSRLYLAASSNAGENFVSTMISIPSKNGEHKTYPLQDGEHYVPKIAGVGNTVNIIWNGLDANDVHSVLFRRSIDSGATFEDVENLTNGVLPTGKSLQQGQETLAAAGNYVYTIFTSTSANIYLRRSVDGGSSFMALQELTAPNTSTIASGWWPVIGLDPSSDGSKVHVLWDWPIYCFSTDGGATFKKPELVTPYYSYSGALSSGAVQPYMTIGSDGKVHFVVSARYYSSFCGGYCDFDIFYRGFTLPPSPTENNMALKLTTNNDDRRYDNMQVPSGSYLNFTSRLTAEIWVKPYAGGVSTGMNSAKPIFHKEGNSNFFSYAISTFDRYGSKRQAACQFQTAAGQVWLNPPDATVGLIEDGVWSHLAMTYDAAGGADNLKLYLNGKLIASKTVTGDIATGDGQLFAGRYGVWEIDELRLWNIARTESQINADMGRQLTGSETGLNAYYNFNNTTKDITGHGNDGILMYKETFVPSTNTTAISVSPANQNVSKDSGTTTFAVSNTGTGTMNWSAAVTSGSSWLTITAGTSGTNSGTITCAYTANTGTASRTGTIRVTANGATGSPKDVTVTQAAAPTTVTISGSAKTGSGTAISGVTITFSNSGGTATTDSIGNYSKTIAYGYSGTATPAKSGYTFSPSFKTFTNATSNQTGQNFTGTPLSSSRQQCLGVWSDGVWIWDKTTNKWTMMSSTASASMIAAGKVDSDTIDDLIGVWATGLYLRQSSNGQWIKLSASLPTWIAAGDLNNDGRDDVVGSWAEDGAYYRNSATGKWIWLSSPAKQLASGNIGGTRDDLAAVYSDGLWVRYSANASWKKLDSGIPIWITVGDMTGDKRADIVGSYGTGTWYRNSATGGWINLTTPAAELAAGDLDGDGRDDLVGIWSNSVYVRYGTTGQWVQISTSKPKWIATGKMVEAIQAAGSLEDPFDTGAEIMDMSDDGPGRALDADTASETDSPAAFE